MTNIDLLGFIDSNCGREYAELLKIANAELRFNDIPVADVIALARDAACAELAQSHGVPPSRIVSHELIEAIYDPLEEAIYVAGEYKILRGADQSQHETVYVEHRIKKDWPIAEVIVTPIGEGTVAKMLELLDVLDLHPLVKLPGRVQWSPAEAPRGDPIQHRLDGRAAGSPSLSSRARWAA